MTKINKNKNKNKNKINTKGGNNWVNEFMTKTNTDINKTIEDLRNLTKNSIKNVENTEIRDFLSKVICEDIQAQDVNETCPNVSDLPDDEIQRISNNLAQRLKEEQSYYPQQYQQTGRLQRTSNFNIESNNNNIAPVNTNNFNEFDTNMKFYQYNQIYNEMIESIYNLMLEYKANNKFSEDQNLKTLMSRLVLIENAFGILRQSQNRFKDSFINILHIIKIDCVDSNVFKKGACLGAALFAQASNILTFLKEQSKILDGVSPQQFHLIEIDDNTLSFFIEKSIPIILGKLREIQHPTIVSIVAKIVNFANNNGIVQVVGGKMKNRKPKMIKKKNILGKERCVYKVYGMKQECVNYKNSFIPVSEFKLLMKNKEKNNTENLSVVLMNIVLTNKSSSTKKTE